MGFFAHIASAFRRNPANPAAPIIVSGVTSEDEDLEEYVRKFGPPPAPPPDQKYYGPLSKKGFDSMSNWMSGQGGFNDPAIAAAYLFAATIDWQTISNMCRASWLARKIVWKRPRDMMRPGYNLVFEGMGDKAKGSIETNGDRLRKAITRKWDADNKLIEGIAWGRQFGGSVIVIETKGDMLDKPFPITNGSADYSSIKKDSLLSLRVWDRWRASHDGALDNNKESPNRGKPEFYVLSANDGQTGVRVHWTRVLRFDGDIVDWWTWRANACWHDSVLQVAIDTLKQYDMLTGAITSLVPKARQDVVYAKKAAERASTAEGRKMMQQRFGATARMASTFNVRVYDMDTERAEQQTFNFGNLDHIWEKAMMESGACAGYPSSVLFDNQPAGLNASGDASKENYYDDLGAERLNMLKPRQLALYEIIARNEFGDVPKGFDIVYNPFRSASELEKSTINKNRADADHVRILDGIITPGLVADELKEDSVYRTMTQEDVDLAKMAPPPMGELETKAEPAIGKEETIEEPKTKPEEEEPAA